MLFRLLSLVSLLAAASGFQAALPLRSAPVQSLTPRSLLLSESETEAILQSASDCAEGECSLDDVSELLFELKDQQVVLEQRLQKVMNTIAHLQHLNEKEDRQTDEVRSFVRDMLRVFAHEKPKFTPSGFSGDIGSGTAYDMLPPKPWKP